MTRGDIDRPIENWLITLTIIIVCIFMMVTGCAAPPSTPETADTAGFASAGAALGEEPDVALQKHAISWPLTGGLDTKKSPLSVQPGSFLRLDNVVQERLNEWRRRNGWTRVDADTMPELAPFMVGKLGDAGLFLNGQSGVSVYSPSLTSSRWSAQAVSQPPQDISRMPVAQTSFSIVGFATNGAFSLLRTVGVPALGVADQLWFVDSNAGPVRSWPVRNVGGNVGLMRGAATADKLCMFQLFGGSLYAYVVDAATGALTGGFNGTAIASGFGTAFPGTFLDARWYGGSTITIVATNATTNSVQFMEWNPSTATMVTNTTLAVNAAAALVLMADPDASGTRIVGLSHTTPTTRVLRVSSAGSILTNDQVEAVQATRIAGVAFTAGADWSVVYQTSANNLRVNYKASGVVGSPATLNGATWDSSASIDTEAWRDPSVPGWSFLLGLHSTATDDPQDSWVQMLMPALSTAAGSLVSTVEPLAAGPLPVNNTSLYQVVRTAACTFMFGLPVQVIYEDNAGTIARHYSGDIFTLKYLTSSDDAAAKAGRPVSHGPTAFVPGGQLSFWNNGTLTPLGTRYPPRILSVTPSAGAGSLTPSSEYEYVATVEQIDNDGRVWRSPPSIPVLVNMGVGQNTNTVVFSSWGLEANTMYRLVLYRSAADGSSPRRWYSQLFSQGGVITVVDTFADSIVNTGEVLYTEGEAPNAITPPAYLAWLADDRLWTVNPEYPTEISYSKNLRPNRLPEFVDENVLDLDDQHGLVTGGGVLDDKIVVFKKNAIYFLQGTGFTDSGSGDNYVATLLSSDQGALPGSPIIQAGDALYFVSERGIQRLDKQGNVTWVGQPVDQYLHQPLVQTPETIFDGCFVPSANEVRFLTTNYVLVHNLTFDYWVRWTLSGFRRCLVVNGTMVMFRNDGTVWREGDQTQLTDQGTDFTGVIRSPWMRPSPGIQGAAPTNTATTGQQGMRLYEGRVIYTRTSGGSNVNLTGRLYANNDDTQVQEFSGQAINGQTLAGATSMKPLAKIQKCTSFSEELVLPSGDVTVRIDGFAAVIGVRGGPQAVEPGSRYK